MPKPKPTLGDRLCNLISSLEKNDNFAVSGLVGPPATQAEIEAARKAAKGHLPPGVEEFYSSIGSFNLEWQFTGRIPRLPNKYSKIPELKEYFSTQFKIGRMGAINILPITEIFSSWTESTWFPTESDIARGYDGSGPDDGDGEEWRYIYRHVKPFDNFQPEACFAFVLQIGKGEDCGRPLDEVWYHYYGEELEETHWTFNEYLERLADNLAGTLALV